MFSKRKTFDQEWFGSDALQTLHSPAETISGVCPICLAQFTRPAGSAYPDHCTRHALVAQGLRPEDNKVVQFMRPRPHAVTRRRGGGGHAPGAA